MVWLETTRLSGYNKLTMLRLQVQLLGVPCAKVAAKTIPFTSDKRYQLLAYLAYQGDWVGREELTYLFWPDVQDRTARHRLRQLLKRVRKLDWLHHLESDQQRLRWRVATDVSAFRRSIKEGRLDEALAHYHGPFLQDLHAAGALEFEHWLEHERERLHNRWREALLARAQALAAQEDDAQAAQLYGRLLEADPFDEDALQAYMKALVRVGQQNQALRRYQAFAAHLAETLGIVPSTTTDQLAQAIRDTASRAPPAAQAVGVETLPARVPRPMPPTPFVGRDLELADVAHLLAKSDCRLLTLMGLGGVGKSRLALQAAEELDERYPDGRYFVSLEAIISPETVPNEIAKALGLNLQGQEEPLRQVIRHLGEKHVLLVLDNFEHLTEGAGLVSTLRRNCPKLDILVTSRERLNLEEEWLLPVEGLVFPQEDAAPLEDALSYDAVQLFVQRAARVQPHFSLDQPDVPHLLKLCRLVGGFPLGLELAAVWVRMMLLADLAQELERSLDVLSSTSRNRAERHQSLRATFEHSWKLLSPKEQEVLRKLSVFRGGFRKEVAAVVAGANLAVLAALVDKSLLRSLPNGRYDRHPLLYQYTQEKLAEHPDEQARARDAHGRYFVRFLQQQDEAVRRGEQRRALLSINEEWENIRPAYRWSVTKASPKDLVRCIELMEVCFELRGQHEQAIEFLSYAEVAFQVDNDEKRAVSGRILLERAWYDYRLGNYQQAAQASERGIAILRPLRRNLWLARGHNVLGLVAAETGDYSRAKSHYQEALALADQGEHLSAYLFGNLANLEHDVGNHAQAEQHYQKALELNRQQGRYTGVVRNLNNLGDLYTTVGKFGDAEALFAEALQLAQAIDFEHIIAYLLANLAVVAFELANYDEAKAYGEKALAMTRKSGEQRLQAGVLADLGQILTALSDHHSAYDYCQEALRLAWSIQAPPLVLHALMIHAKLMASRGEIDRAALLLQIVARHSATMKRDVDASAGLLKVLQDQLAPEMLAAALERSKSMSLEAVVAEALRQQP